MNIECSVDNSFCRGNLLSLLFHPDQFDPRDRELELQYRSEHDPERPPKWKPGDKYTVIGVLVGVILGGALVAIGDRYFGFTNFFFGIAGGTIIGGIIGATVGDLIRKHRQKTKKS